METADVASGAVEVRFKDPKMGKAFAEALCFLLRRMPDDAVTHASYTASYSGFYMTIAGPGITAATVHRVLAQAGAHRLGDVQRLLRDTSAAFDAFNR